MLGLIFALFMTIGSATMNDPETFVLESFAEISASGVWEKFWVFHSDETPIEEQKLVIEDSLENFCSKFHGENLVFYYPDPLMQH